MGEGPLDAAAGIDGEPDVGGVILGVEGGKDFGGGLGVVGSFKEALEVFFGVAGDGDFAEGGGGGGTAGVNEDEDVAVAGVGAGRSDVFAEGVVVELFVDDDPHIDVVAAHHVEECGVALGEPALADGDLLRPGGEIDGRVFCLRGGGQGESEGEGGEEGAHEEKGIAGEGDLEWGNGAGRDVGKKSAKARRRATGRVELRRGWFGGGLLGVVGDEAAGGEVVGDLSEDGTEAGDGLGADAGGVGAGLVVVGEEVLGGGGHERHGLAGGDVGVAAVAGVVDTAGLGGAVGDGVDTGAGGGGGKGCSDTLAAGAIPGRVEAVAGGG